MKTKLITVLCIIILLFNLILGSSYAADEVLEDPKASLTFEYEAGNSIETDNMGIFKDIIDGVSKIGDESSKKIKSVISLKYLVSPVSGVLVNIMWGFLEMGVEILLTPLNLDYFTVYELVMGEYDFFNVDFSKTASTDTFLALKEKVEQGTNSVAELVEYNKLLSQQGASGTLFVTIQSNVMKYYSKLRNVSLGISLIVLIYIGIRMALSTVTSDKVKYKKMFINWVASVFLLFFMHFIIILYGYITTAVLDLIKEIAVKLSIDNVEHNITMYFINLIKKDKPGGFTGIANLIVTAMFIYYQIKFLITYIKRYCEIIFLIVISPLVTITYPIDKVGDNKAQAFQAWLKELSMKYFLQIAHAITYCVLIFTAGEIAKAVQVFGILFLFTLDKVEKMIRNILDINENGYEKVRMPRPPRFRH